MPDYFPEGSGAGTSAKPAIWSDFVGFKDAAEANYYAAQDLIAAAAKQDAKAAGEALQAVGGTCKDATRNSRAGKSQYQADEAAAVHGLPAATRRSAPARAIASTG